MKSSRGSKTTKTKRRSTKQSIVTITHPERVVYPESDITKGDVAAYYQQIADVMLPYLAGRPLSLVRCPDGIAQCFFQKHPPPGMPDVVDRVRIRENEGMHEYVAVHDRAGLMTLIQFNTLEIHVWGSRVNDVERPDRIVFDLDPAPDVAWKEVVETARLFRKLLEKLGLAVFLKTTGGKGLHVVAPIKAKHDWDTVKQFCRDAVEFLARLQPERYVTQMSKAKRTGKIFLDYLRNDRGATWVAPYSTRARADAPVSMPIDWNELSKLKSGADFTLANAPQRLKARRKDPWAGIDKAAKTLTETMLRAVRVRG